LSDYKTSSGIYADMFIQLGLYKIAIEEWMNVKVDALEILRFGKDGVFEPRYTENIDQINDYVSQGIRVLQTANFRRKYEDQF